MKKVLFVLSMLLVLFSACQDNHFLKDAAYRNQVHQQFEQRKSEAVNRQAALFSVFENQSLTVKQREALEFLYAYMPLNDLADKDGDYFLQQVDYAFKARDYFSWSKTIPEDIFRHFVLVYRINNENLDTARVAFFDELKERVKDLSMYDAALEVNHWCHEKVTYRGTDARTSGSLALIKTAWGRCGEESTFTATALRAVGIPARQCYTPRWAHTDDNHAWVEVWIDGKWHYMGACEPEPELDVAWFTAPAKRAMMVHTKVFGLYNGPEEKNSETPLYSVINLTANYTQTREVKVRVVDADNQPVEGARVQFKLYNYAELYPISTNTTGKNGETSISSGLGDVVVWADKGTVYGYQKSESTSPVTVVKLDRQSGTAYAEEYVINVPQEQPVKEISAEKIAANVIRLAQEDSIRNAYMATFATQASADKLAVELGLNKDEVWKQLELSQGNWQEITDFITAEKQNPHLFPFLASLKAKDLRDTPASVLSNHINTVIEQGSVIPAKDRVIPTKGHVIPAKAGIPPNLIAPYILSPRTGIELITPWRGYFKQKSAMNAGQIIQYIKENITINNEDNYYNCPLTPRGSYELRLADKRSRTILFVAMCRDNTIPARLETTTSKPQYYDKGHWIDVVFDPSENATSNLPQATLTLKNDPSNSVKPGYESHYTLAVFKNGDFQTLNYEGNALLSNFPAQLTLDEGYYRLMVGSRANDGSVTVHTEYFNLQKNKPQTITVKLPEVKDKLFVKGIVDMNTEIELDNQKTGLKKVANGQGLLICFLDPGKEPSKHILQDLPAVRTQLEAWNGGVLMLIPSDKASTAFDATAFQGMPKQTTWGVDTNRALLNAVAGALQIDFQDGFPLTVYLSRNGGILYSTTGYHIGTGESVWKIIQQEK
ncbi:MAG: transglutaminase domain-containing protein [Candidatus Symbiothrix sp.]|jgi:transglutaminase-like putative cysteine protease|nr:transglutaminase domain-containing protein [Candidatus Symbiothrix sp.]